MSEQCRRVVTWVALEIEDADFPEVAIHQKCGDDRDCVRLPPDRIADLIEALQHYSQMGITFQSYRTHERRIR